MPSRAITLTWDLDAPGACTGWGGTNHILIVAKEGTSPPSSPTDGQVVANVSTSTTSQNDFVHRSGTNFSYAVFACQDSGDCDPYYGDGGGVGEVVSDTTSSGQTDEEIWVIVGNDGSAGDVDNVVINDKDANAPDAFFYPANWTNGSYNDRLALYWSTSANGSTKSKVYYSSNNTGEGWPSGALNDPSTWAAQTLVAEGTVTSSTYDDHHADHPWSMRTTVSSTSRMRLYLQTQNQTNNQIIQIQSVDTIGIDFGLSCTTSCSAICNGASGACDGTPGDVAIDATGGGGNYIASAMHSRIYWDYITDQDVTTADEPFMMFQLGLPQSGGTCEDPSLGYDDIGRADGYYSALSGHWEWTPVVDGGGCAEVYVDDVHDNTYIPLPGDNYKMYYQEHGGTDFFTRYGDGDSWNAEVPIHIYWDDGTWNTGSPNGPTTDCINNISTLVHIDGANVEEAMFFMLKDSDAGGCSTGLDDDGSSSGDEDTAIVYARHMN